MTPIPTCIQIKPLVTIPRAAMAPLSKSLAQKLIPDANLSGSLATFEMMMLKMNAYIRLLIGL